MSDKEVNNNPDEKTEALVLDKEWLYHFYEQVGRETSLSRESQRETHNWVITLTIGVITAILALGRQDVNNPSNSQLMPFIYPTEGSFIAVLAVTPILFRLFVRSCLEYSNFNRWSSLREAIDRYFYESNVSHFNTDYARNYLLNIIPLYYFQWKSPKRFKKMLFDNIKLAYGWPFILLFSLLIWGIIFQVMTPAISFTSHVVGIWMILEIYWFISYRGFKYAEPQTKLPDIS